ncbi:histidine kinase [Marinobacter salinexigens]|uniref:histidine kinase n=1 Tax=Marinobacter salinexigens TaxID=2919747 RepID=A0A5B0VB88_9GAMM|nr:ATP-binding protein [Marinobacter salinexigens]KAA1171455.1 histidine kinase [Marinobacter salinexigens]
MTTQTHDRLFHSLIWLTRIATFVLIVAAAVILDTASTERYRSDVRQQWQVKADDLSLKLQSVILQNVQTVWGLAANVSVDPNIDAARFHELASVIFRLAPDLRNIGLAPDFVIRHVYPEEGNRAAIGLDLTSQSLSPEQVTMLLESERAIFSGPINLVQGGQGLAARIPIFDNNGKRFWGVVSVILDLPKLYKSIDFSTMASEGMFALSESSDPLDASAMFFRTAGSTWKQPVHASMQMPGTTWTLFAQPSQGWPVHPESPWLIRSMLLFMILVVTGGTFWLTRLLLKDREMQRRFWGLFELAPVGIGLYEANQRTLLRANKSFKRVVGDGATSLNYFNAARDENNTEFEGGLNIPDLLSRRFRFTGFETGLPDATGELRPILLHGLKLDTRDSEPVIWLIAEDISERKKVERMKSEFISTVSHELRTPLTSISGSLGLLANNAAGALPEKATALANIAYRNSKQLTFLINDLLDIEKLVAGKMTFRPESHLLAEVIRECVEDIGNFAEERQVTLDIGHLDELTVEVDRRRFSQALHNLLSNAIKFSPQETSVRVFTERHNSRIRVCVEDQGPGIAPDFQGLIFQKFSQADASDRRSKGGTGLGLAITRELMTRMNGIVDYSSPPGKGATFWLELPVVKPT